MEDVIRIRDEYYILATSSLADDRTRVLKHGETFAVFDRYGDIQPTGLGEQGLYHEGTRFLSRLEVRLAGQRPLLLSSTLREDNTLLTVDLTNPDISSDGRVVLLRDTLHMFRSKLLWQGSCYERFRFRNYAHDLVETSIAVRFAADFADIFEVRGIKRARRGMPLPAELESRHVVLAYRGLDGVVRRTRLQFSPEPTSLTDAEVIWRIRMPPHSETTVFLTVSCEADLGGPSIGTYNRAATMVAEALRQATSRTCSIYTSNEQFNDLVNRSLADIHMMITHTPEGPFPYAGVPWFSTPFGRDGLITALGLLWVNPDIARGVLAFLASTQAKEVLPESDAEPGKIVHEIRRGEMAAVGEIPFGCHYGSIDATPLFVILAGAYYDRAGEKAFIEELWPSIAMALEWIDRWGDMDGDGFVEYARRSRHGLIHQGWKDSDEAVFHADGSLAEGAIALCEVQAYVYAAKTAAAALADCLGKPELAERLRNEARVLQERFEEAFWCEDLGTYALALDGDKRPCRVKSSNAGQCLFSGIVAPERARRVAETLLHHDSFSGWGVRTVGASEIRYNPMSYHNGSVWPHDNALIAFGLARYRLSEPLLRILAGLFDASLFMDLHRLPELFCGFHRRPGEGPTSYPVACAPQSWAASSVFLFLQACIGLSFHGPEQEIRFSHPVLPPFLHAVEIRHLRINGGSLDFVLRRHAQDVGIEILRKEGEVRVTTVK
ncbi:MAG: glycogen debranching N-terminal domain-containing protein [Candidatus Methylomirabilales bacterium]